MPIPDYQTVMLPLLKLIAKHGPMNRDNAVRLIEDQFQLSEAERRELLPSGKFTIIQSRVGWARTYLKKAGLIDYPSRGVAIITERGKQTLIENFEKINLEYLRKFQEFRDFEVTTHEKKESNQRIDLNTPEEIFENTHFQLKSQILADIIAKVKSCSPHFFENLVVEVVVKMGYGGSLKEAGRAIGKSGDEGIDGIINQDRLGLDVIYLQAKRWEANVGRPSIQEFAGALQGKRAKRGIFITTSDFTADAREYVKNLEAKIILVPGKQLAELMWEYNVGLNTLVNYEIKALDLEYFIE